MSKTHQRQCGYFTITIVPGEMPGKWHTINYSREEQILFTVWEPPFMPMDQVKREAVDTLVSRLKQWANHAEWTAGHNFLEYKWT